MKPIRQHWRAVLRVISALFICAGAFSGYWWLYKLAPSRHTLDPEWCASHSQRELWREVQKGIRRGIWFHDDGFTVGMYGDKSWAEWIMAHVKRGTSMGCIGDGPCHSATSMRYISDSDEGERNQDDLHERLRFQSVSISRHGRSHYGTSPNNGFQEIATQAQQILMLARLQA